MRSRHTHTHTETSLLAVLCLIEALMDHYFAFILLSHESKIVGLLNRISRHTSYPSRKAIRYVSDQSRSMPIGSSRPIAQQSHSTKLVFFSFLFQLFQCPFLSPWVAFILPSNLVRILEKSICFVGTDRKLFAWIPQTSEERPVHLIGLSALLYGTENECDRRAL